MNPIPRVDAKRFPEKEDAFPAPCDDPNAPPEGGHGGLCSGWYGPDDLEVRYSSASANSFVLGSVGVCGKD